MDALSDGGWSQGAGGLSREKWVRQGAGGSDSYSYVASLFNFIHDIHNSHVSTETVYKKLRFGVYDRDMAHGIGSSHPLKPSLLGSRWLPEEGYSMRWRAVDLAVVFENNWKLLLAQANTYAHALFHTRKSRWFSLVIGVRYDTCAVQFLFFYRGGLTSS